LFFLRLFSKGRVFGAWNYKRLHMIFKMAKASVIEQPIREELVAAWHRRSPEVTYEHAAVSFNGWRLGVSIWL